MEKRVSTFLGSFLFVTYLQDKPDRIFIYAASVFHFDINDPSSTCFNPSPPSEASREIRSPTIAFYDSLISTFYDPPLPSRS